MPRYLNSIYIKKMTGPFSIKIISIDCLGFGEYLHHIIIFINFYKGSSHMNLVCQITFLFFTFKYIYFFVYLISCHWLKILLLF